MKDKLLTYLFTSITFILFFGCNVENSDNQPVSNSLSKWNLVKINQNFAPNNVYLFETGEVVWEFQEDNVLIIEKNLDPNGLERPTGRQSGYYFVEIITNSDNEEMLKLNGFENGGILFPDNDTLILDQNIRVGENTSNRTVYTFKKFN